MGDLVGQQLGNYRLIRLLGKGGFAEVYLAEHMRLGTRAAVKVLSTRLVSNEEREHFEKEARMIAHLKHPHIVRVLDFDVRDDIPFLVMEYASGGTLRQRHPKGTALPLPTIVNYLKQSAEALQYAHNHQLIHRDVKPENMLLGPRDDILLSDFGIALVAQSSRYQSTQEMVGTMAYMAPEQIQGKPKPASDQYSLGIIVYEWLCGDRPFRGSLIELVGQHLAIAPPSLLGKLPTIPPDVESVVQVALAKDPKARFSSVQAFATAFEQASRPVQRNVVISPPPRPSAALEIGSAGNVPMSAPPQSQSPPPMPLVEPVSGFQEQIPNRGQSAFTSALPPPPTPRPSLVVSPMPAAPGWDLSRRRVLAGIVTVATVSVVGGGITWFAFNNASVQGGGTGTASSAGSVVQGAATIKVATDFPVSGRDTSNGKPAENGAHLAVAEANTNKTIPGYTLEFLPKDDVGLSGAHDPATGSQNVTALVGDALVAGIVGPFNSSVAQAEMPIANNAPIAIISPSNTNQCLTQTGADIGCTGANDLVPTLRPTGKVTYFRIATSDDHQGPAMADYLYNTQHYKKAYVVDDTEVYGKGIANTFTAEWKKLGGTILGRDSQPGTTTSFVSLLTKIAATQPDVIYFGGTDATGGTLMRQQMQQVPALQNTPFAGGDGIVSASFAQTVGLTGGPVFGSVASSDVNQNPAAAVFINKYKATYGDLGAYSAAGYDCMQVLIHAIKVAIDGGAVVPKDSGDATGAKTFRQAVVDAIQKTDYNGLTGHHTFDQNGDTTNKVITIQQLADVTGKPGWRVLTSLTVK